MKQTVTLTGQDLTIEQFLQIARGLGVRSHRHMYPRVELSEGVQQNLTDFREGMVRQMNAGKIMYGINTGVGVRKGIVIPNDEIIAYQKHYIPAHCVGTGSAFVEEIVRGVLALRVNSFAKGNSGVTLELCAKVLELYNKGVIPHVPQQGSVGSSGDLAPLSHVAATMTAVDGQLAYFKGELMAAAEALEKAGITPIVLQAKEAMGFTNGATFIQSTGLLAAVDAFNLLQYSNCAAALSLEAIRGETAAYDERIHRARNHPGQIDVANDVLALLAGTERATHVTQSMVLPGETKKYIPGTNGTELVPRVQDAYSFRCYPQVGGSAAETIKFALRVFKRELNASTDNPLVFPSEDSNGEYDVLSGGNFHGEPLGHASDFLKIAVQSLANISDRRLYNMLSPGTSYGLPQDLAGDKNINTGLMILQYMTASIVSENKVLCHPASVDSIPTSSGQEDYVSMGTTAARHARQVVENGYAVIAAELLAAAQAISLTQEDLNNPALGKGTQVVYEAIREVVSVMDGDRFIRTDHQKVIELLKSGEILRRLEALELPTFISQSADTYADSEI